MSSAASRTLSNGQGSHKMLTAMEKRNLGHIRQATPDSDAVVSSDDDHEPSGVMSQSMHSNMSLPVSNQPVRRESSGWMKDAYTPIRKYSLGGPTQAPGAGSQPSTPSAENGPANSHVQNVLTTAGSHGGTYGSGSDTVAGAQPWGNMTNASTNVHPTSSFGRPGTGHSTGNQSFTWNSPLWNSTHSHPASAQKGVSSHTSRWPSASNTIDSPSSSTIPSQLQHLQVASPTTLHDDLRSPLSMPPDHSSSIVPSSLPFEIPLEPNRKTIRSQSYSSGLKRTALTRRSSRPAIPPMDSSHDERSLYEVDEDEFAATSGWDNNPLTTTVSNPVTTEQINKPGSSGSRASQHSPKRQHHNLLIRSKAAPFLPLHATPNPEEPDTDIALDTYGEEQIAAGTQRAAEHAQATLANAAAQRYERPAEQGQTSRFFGAPSSSSPSQHRLNQGHPPPFVPNQHLTYETMSHPEALLSGERTSLLELSKQRYFSSAPGNHPMTDESIPEDIHPSQWRTMYIVSFKANRSEVFVLDEQMKANGIEVNQGDMVIVDGDRGADMGIVKEARLTWEEAAASKAMYNRLHYKSLVMFSRMFPHVANAANSDAGYSESTDAVAASNLAESRQRKPGNPLQPKFIRRIASESEVKLLLDKEGNEAKAKRICQAKVNAHGIHMEILDAEFQLDYKKLTFYFYAEQYINFNDLVTELFKIWKLRIWLSAVNPASYPEQRSRPNRGNRLRGPDQSLGGGSSDMDHHEHAYRDAHHHPNSGALMQHPYSNATQQGYGTTFAPPSYIQNQQPSFAQNFGQSNPERVAMNPAYFGSPASPVNFTTATSANFPAPTQWSSFGNHFGMSNYPALQTGSTATSGQGNLAGQSLAGFASATPFFPNSYQSGARRTSSIGANHGGDTTDRRRVSTTSRAQASPPSVQTSPWPSSYQAQSPSTLSQRPNIGNVAQMPRGTWTFGDFSPSTGSPVSGVMRSPPGLRGQRSGDDLSLQFGSLNMKGDDGSK